ncbi:MAG: CPBP family glutamic-type intramembrane protease [Bacteroidota bacterium]
MNQSTNPLIPFGWLRALLFFAFFFLVFLALEKGTGELLNILQKAETGKDKIPDEIVHGDIWLQVCISSASAFISVWIFRSFIDRQSLWSLGFAWQGFAKHAWTGFLAAIAMLGIGSLLLVAMKYLSFADAQFDPVSLASNIGLMLLVALAEELFFRGYILNNLMQSVNKWLALVISAALFAAVHIGNPAAKDSVLPVIEVFIGGLMLGINYIYTKNLWFGIFLHFGWNFFMGPVLGYEVSGINLQPVLTQNITGPELWTGGAFGFEGSVLSLVLNLAVTGILVWVYERKRLVAS